MPSDIRLRYLYEASRLGTMNAASESLDIATSSVSRQLAKLEAELGLPLIEKGRRKIRLTEAGEVVCAYYRKKLSQEEAFLSHIDEMKKVQTGKIVLAIGEAFITRRFSDTLDDFMQRYPGMEIQVKTANTTAVCEQIREDSAHVGLIFDSPREPDISARAIIPAPLRIIVPNQHPLQSAQGLSLQSIQEEKIGLPEAGYRIRQLIREAEQEEGVFLEASLVTNSLALLKDFVLAGRGISILPELVVHDSLQNGSLHAIASSNPVLRSTQTSLITRVGRQLPVGAYRLMTSLQAFLRGAANEAELPSEAKE